MRGGGHYVYPVIQEDVVAIKDGEPLDFLALRAEQFIVVWRVETQEWLSVAERAAALIANLPDETAQEVLDFARFLSARSRQTAGGKGRLQGG